MNRGGESRLIVSPWASKGCCGRGESKRERGAKYEYRYFVVIVILAERGCPSQLWLVIFTYSKEQGFKGYPNRAKYCACRPASEHVQIHALSTVDTRFATDASNLS